MRRLSNPATFPSSAFLTPSTVCAATSLVGLFHPTATSRVRPPGVYSPRTVASPRRRGVPSRRWRRFAAGTCAPAPLSVASPTGLLSVRGSAADLRCLAAESARSPPGLSLLQVLPLIVAGTPSRPLPLMTFSKSPSSRPLRWPSAFLRRARLASLEVADLLRFLACLPR